MRTRLRTTRRRRPSGPEGAAPALAGPPARPGLLHRIAGAPPPLHVSQPGDGSEREAERVADAVVRGPAARAAPAPSSASPSAAPLASALGQGRPLADPDRTFFEARLGHDFGGVRVHDDARSAQAADALGARAFVLGSDVAFARGEYAPGTDRGRRLLAHELAHVVQQRRMAAPSIQRQAAASPTTARTRVELPCPGALANAVILVSTPWQTRFGIGHPTNVGTNDLFIAGLDAGGRPLPGQGSFGLRPGESARWYTPPEGAAKIGAACSKTGDGAAVLEYDAPAS